MSLYKQKKAAEDQLMEPLANNPDEIFTEDDLQAI